MFEPGTIGNLTTSNRIVLAPLTRSRCAPDLNPGKPWVVDYYTQRAGCGLIVSEACAISEGGYGFGGAPGIFNDDQVKGWQEVTKAVHEKNGLIFCQLWHMGRVSEFFVRFCLLYIVIVIVVIIIVIIIIVIVIVIIVIILIMMFDA